MTKKIENFLRHNYYAKWLATRFLQFVCFFNPAFDAHRVYKKYYSKRMNLKSPKTLPEKIVWMELNADTSMWTYCEDKYLMRKYVEDKGYGEHLPKLYGVWCKAKDIDFNTLPNEFVIKSNHGCGDVIVCTDKRKIDVEAIRKSMQRQLSLPYGYNCAALHYTKIKRLIIAEEVLNNDYTEISRSMVDFKVWCINGKMQSVLIVYDRDNSTGVHSVDLYDKEWNRIDHFLNKNSSDRIIDKIPRFPKPESFGNMIEIAEDLATPFSQVRIDFYIVNNKPIIGEMSFMAGYGSYTEEYYNILAEDIELVSKR